MPNATRNATVIKAHQRSYDDPVRLRAGERVRITKRDLWEDEHLWLWCVKVDADDEPGGWVPASLLQIEGDINADITTTREIDGGEKAVAARDYSALELSVTPGEVVQAGEAIGGWVWVQNRAGESGWVPAGCLRIDAA